MQTIKKVVNFVKIKNNNMKDTRFPFKLELNQAQEIINIACESWKEKLTDKWAKELILNNFVVVDEHFYETMRKDCTEEQNILFDKIFGKDGGEFEVGETVYWSGDKPTFGRITGKDDCFKDCYVLDVYGNTKTYTSCSIQYLRKATPQEIEEYELKEKFPYEKGELIFVSYGDVWDLRYFSHVKDNKVYCFSNQQKEGELISPKYHAKADNITLPKKRIK